MYFMTIQRRGTQCGRYRVHKSYAMLLSVRQTAVEQSFILESSIGCSMQWFRLLFYIHIISKFSAGTAGEIIFFFLTGF